MQYPTIFDQISGTRIISSQVTCFKHLEQSHRAQNFQCLHRRVYGSILTNSKEMAYHALCASLLPLMAQYTNRMKIGEPSEVFGGKKKRKTKLPTLSDQASMGG
jgi:hypothetical protein